MEPVTPERTHALFAVLDGDNPSEWSPWGTRIEQLRERARELHMDSLPSTALEIFNVDLIAHPPNTLLARDSWTGVVGAVVDATVPRPQLRRLHHEICQRISRSKPAPLCRRVGYYLAFSVPATLTDDHHVFMSDLRRDARDALKLDPWAATAGFHIRSDDVFEAALSHFISQMEIIAQVKG